MPAHILDVLCKMYFLEVGRRAIQDNGYPLFLARIIDVPLPSNSFNAVHGRPLKCVSIPYSNLDELLDNATLDAALMR